MFVMKKMLLGLVSTVALTSVGFANPQPPLGNVQAARAKVVTMKNHLDGVIRQAGGGGGGGHNPGGGELSCRQIRDYQSCVRSGCQWNGLGEIGRCVDRQVGPRVHRFESENDVAAQLSAIGISNGMEKLANDLFNMAANYYAPQFWNYWTQACNRSGGLLVANQGAKLAAALPQVGFYQPSYFEMYDQELIATRQLIWCF
jgi:hypothetical protein